MSAVVMVGVVALQAAEGPQVSATLTPFALLFMLVSMVAVTLLTVWCFVRVLRGRVHFDPDGTGPAHSPVRGEAKR